MCVALSMSICHSKAFVCDACNPIPDDDPIISKFGRYGDGIEVVIAQRYHLGFNVLCGSNNLNMSFVWVFSNGSRIGNSNRGFRQVSFENGEYMLYTCSCQSKIR